ncbi:MAG: calcium/sodium antiporter [Pirellulaceae bacterium]|nr:calcium/sodium antiporter [Pirellulaceae bacterium]
MTLFWPIVAIIAGLAGLTLGGDFLVRGAERLAFLFRISPLVVGLTVVAFGTSAPEAAVTVQAAWIGSEIGVGNVVGSNIFNILFILGLSATLVPLVVSSQLIRRDVPLMVVCSIAVYLAVLNGTWGRTEGAVAVVVLLAYTIWIVRSARRETMLETAAKNNSVDSPDGLTESRSTGIVFVDLAYVVGGLALLIVASRVLIWGSVEVARAWQISELVIGLTIIAAGTSLPEVVTSIVASLRGQRDIAVGNIVGSNLFNLLFVMGLAGVVSPNPLSIPDKALWFDFPIMVVVAIACLPIFFDGKINRWEGFLFLFYYVAYVVYMILNESGSGYLSPFTKMLYFFAVPLTLLTLALSIRSAISRKRIAP